MLNIGTLAVNGLLRPSNQMLLISTRPAHQYVDNQRTDTITGYQYEILLPDLGYERIRVKINGTKCDLGSPIGEPMPVTFVGLRAHVYVRNGEPQISFAADSIVPIA